MPPLFMPSVRPKRRGKARSRDASYKKGNQYFFEMKAHIGADVEPGLVPHVHGTAANVADVTQVAELLHGEEDAVYTDAGYTNVEKRSHHVSQKNLMKHLVEGYDPAIGPSGWSQCFKRRCWDCVEKWCKC